jgi:hypothetical protein
MEAMIATMLIIYRATEGITLVVGVEVASQGLNQLTMNTVGGLLWVLTVEVSLVR